jgi:histidinol phosphatase-like enzyme (inositol monophosphatase family)
VALERELAAARALAERAGRIALEYQARGIQVDSKVDLSPVTAADRECERMISQALEEAFPQDGLLGEEGAVKKSSSGRRWIIDPIDGTRDFVRGVPTWAVLIGLENGSQVDVGVCHFPAQGRTYYAVRGGGAFRDGERIGVSSISEPSQALLCINGFNDVLKFPFAPRLLEWVKQFWAVRSFGGCQDAVLVASGSADAWIEPGGKPWDFAALKVIAEEAGAVFFNFDGRSTIYGGNCAVCAPGLEIELRRFVLGVERKGSPDARPPLTRELDLGRSS